MKRRRKELEDLARGIQTNQAVALKTTVSPFHVESPYHAFSPSPPVVYRRDGLVQWTCRLLHDDSNLYCCWELEGKVAPKAEGNAFETRERVSCALWDESTGPAGDIHLVECDYTGETRQQCGPSSASFKPTAKEQSLTVLAEQLAVGCGFASSPVPSAVSGLDAGLKQVVMLKYPLEHLHRAGSGMKLRMALFRAANTSGASGLTWARWPEMDDEAGKHLSPESMAPLSLEGAGCPLDNSCCAVTLQQSVPCVLRLRWAAGTTAEAQHTAVGGLATPTDGGLSTRITAGAGQVCLRVWLRHALLQGPGTQGTILLLGQRRILRS